MARADPPRLTPPATQHQAQSRDLQELVHSRAELQLTLTRTIAERDSLMIQESEKAERVESLSSENTDLKSKLDDLKYVEEKNSGLENQLSALNSVLVSRVNIF